MAGNSAKAVNMARNLAITYLVVGFLLFCFGIADRAIGNFWTGYVCFGVWAGTWVSSPCSVSNIMSKMFSVYPNIPISMLEGDIIVLIQCILLCFVETDVIFSIGCFYSALCSKKEAL